MYKTVWISEQVADNSIKSQSRWPISLNFSGSQAGNHLVSEEERGYSLFQNPNLIGPNNWFQPITAVARLEAMYIQKTVMSSQTIQVDTRHYLQSQ